MGLKIRFLIEAIFAHRRRSNFPAICRLVLIRLLTAIDPIVVNSTVVDVYAYKRLCYRLSSIRFVRSVHVYSVSMSRLALIVIDRHWLRQTYGVHKPFPEIEDNPHTKRIIRLFSMTNVFLCKLFQRKVSAFSSSLV